MQVTRTREFGQEQYEGLVETKTKTLAAQRDSLKNKQEAHADNQKQIAQADENGDERKGQLRRRRVAMSGVFISGE